MNYQGSGKKTQLSSRYKWHKASDFSLAAHGVQAIYITGGIRFGKPVNSVYRYGIKGDAWQEVKPMVQKRFQHSSCVLKDVLFAFGGLIDGNKSTPTIESVDLKTDEDWNLVSIPQFNRRIQAVLCKVNDSQIVVFGGKGDKNMIVFDTDRNRVVRKFDRFGGDICSNGPACYVGDGTVIAQVLEHSKSGLNLYSIVTGELVRKIL